MSQTAATIATTWRDDITPALHDYIAIPALSVAFDAEWAAHGHLHQAAELICRWASTRPIRGLRVELVQLAGHTPTILIEVPGSSTNDDTVLLYGHYDKQPEMTGWRAPLGPWTPVIEGERLYGRGGADDGYSAFAVLAAIEALQRAGLPHARCAALIEGSEESGSVDLPAYVDDLAERIGTPSLVIALDSGALSYDRLWVTTSLRGLIGGTLTVKVLEEGKHSGAVSGIVASSFRIARALLGRIEDEATGEILVPELHRRPLPAERVADAYATMADFPDALAQPFSGATRPVVAEPAEQLLNATWRPTLSVTGADGIPPIAAAGNVLRPHTSLKLSVRLPPGVDPSTALDALGRRLTADPPYGATVSFTGSEAAPGWEAPPFEPWLLAALDEASREHWGQPVRFFGEGGTIPFMGMLAERFPRAQFVVAGVLGPDANAHGPNEFLHPPMAERVTASIADVLAHHAARPS